MRKQANSHHSIKTQPILQTLRTPSRNPLRLVSTVAAALLALAPWASAQTPPVLGLHLYAGLTITGAVGTVYSVKFVTDLAKTTSWRCLEFLQLPASPYLWADKSAPATGQRFYRAVQTGAPTNMVFIPPGTFRMGSPTNEVDRFDWEGPQTAVTISRGFWMAKYEVTQEEYLAVTGYNPSWFKGVRDGANAVIRAEKAVAATERKAPWTLATLAAAYAEVGQFEKAVTTQQEAIGLLQTEEKENDFQMYRMTLRDRHCCGFHP